MTGHRPLDRRSTLERIGAVVALVISRSTASKTATQQRNFSSTPPESSHETYRTDIYSGTVDRIVDREHVVILIEDGGQVVDQRVVSADAYPDIEEGDSVELLIYRGEILTVC